MLLLIATSDTSSFNVRSLPPDPDPKTDLFLDHYSNPQSLDGLIDNSGFKIYTTKESRKYEAGLFVLGMPPDHRIQIPPNETDWHQLGTCPEEYTQYLEAFSPMKKMVVFATGLHAHYLGKQIWTAHYRNGSHLGYIGKNEYYSFVSIEYYYRGPYLTICLQEQSTFCGFADRNLAGRSIGHALCLGLDRTRSSYYWRRGHRRRDVSGASIPFGTKC